MRKAVSNAILPIFPVAADNQDTTYETYFKGIPNNFGVGSGLGAAGAWTGSGAVVSESP